ncbi:hypothetical protein F2Q69_00028606 [Brassica cretica]|uniref:Zinc knuckle CX2CX4HX4C domain-containing protein n=1 Tax=Brassica cretica TaxID=69181 RepID=A0A8S9RYY3_BRACR|nr:hypothetical protein F2Q69_00028606 [Brassica cretica]
MFHLNTAPCSVSLLIFLASKEKEELAAREAFSSPFRGRELHRSFESHARTIDTHPRLPSDVDTDRRRQEQPQRREERTRYGQAQRKEHGDLRSKILSKREDLAKNVWNRIDHSFEERNPRDRERYHPYIRDRHEESKYSSRDFENRSVRGRHGGSASSSSWRVKGFSPESRGRNQVQTNKDQQYMRSKVDLPSKSTRNSPDSQRTISETHRYNRGDGAGRRQHSPRLQPRMEWRPTREPEKRGDEQRAPSPNRRNERKAVRDTEHESRRKLKGKAIMEKEKEMVTSPERVISLRSSVETGSPSLNRPSLEELYKPADDEQDMTEEELKEFDEHYVSVQPEMDEDMMDNDDLLDETMVGTRSPDTKGLAASKKLANRGRASLKSKQAKQERLFATKVPGSTVVPRIEVYPLVTKGRKSSAASDTVDVEKGRVRVVVNADEPLQFERKAGYANDDVIKVSLIYEELHRYCFTCKRISHEEGMCPELTPEQREANHIARLESKEKEELAAREAFSAPVRGRELHRGFESHARTIDTHPRLPRDVDTDRRRQEQPQRR